jgi:hypothetical protein
MRNKQKTIESLRRLAERPGTPNEGAIARRLLEQLGAKTWVSRPFDPSLFPQGTVVFYCYRCYKNDRGVIRTKPPKRIQGEWWVLIKFDHLKQARWVPVTSELGCHLSLTPFDGNERDTLYRMDLDWEENLRKFIDRLDVDDAFRARMVRAMYSDKDIDEEEKVNETQPVRLATQEPA